MHLSHPDMQDKPLQGLTMIVIRHAPCFKSHMLPVIALPADPDDSRVAIARRGLRGLPGQTRTNSS